MSESEVIYCEIVAVPPSEGGGFCARVPALGRTACRADGQTAMQALAALVAGLQPREHLSNLEIMNTPEGREWSAAIEASLVAGLADGVRPYAGEAPPAPVKPLYEHDCDRCTYLGQFVGGPGTDAEEPADLYVCAKFWKSTPGMVDVIVRYSSEGSDYSSYPSSIADARPAQFKAVHECLRRYRERLEKEKGK